MQGYLYYATKPNHPLRDGHHVGNRDAWTYQKEGILHNYEKALMFIRRNPKYAIYRYEEGYTTDVAWHNGEETFFTTHDYAINPVDVTEELKAEVKRRLAAGERV